MSILKSKTSLVPTAPHIAQSTDEYIEVLEHTDLQRKLKSDMKSIPNLEYPIDSYSVNHWGQRKLLMSEIEFLTLHSSEQNNTVLYIGAAPGTHIPYLLELFPYLNFILYDPAEFFIEESERIQIKQEYFTNETISKVDSNVLLISDIRAGDKRVLGLEGYAEQERKDMMMQMEWVQAIKPIAYMLKFKLREEAEPIRYLKGDIHLPVWGKIRTSESRLISTSLETVEYDTKYYREQMTYFNRFYRVKYFNHPYNVYGHCYDCTAEIRILEEYMMKVFNKIDSSRIEEMAEEISRKCSRKGRKLMTHISKDVYDRWYKKRIYDIKSGSVIDNIE